ncbi:MAG TPA: exosortase F system-associated protein [Ohtaekwangia sp.]|nr:exosortase F system-associated protein [Ohtaekwangia sp.]
MLPLNNITIRWLAGITCTAGLTAVYLFQGFDMAMTLELGSKPIERFLVNRTIRFVLNDAFTIGIIYALFEKRKYVLFAVAVQFTGMIVFLFPYFVLKLYFPGYNGPLLSFLHRLIVNPVLLLLLIPAFYYQRQMAHKT